MRLFYFTLAFMLFCGSISAQSTKDYAVQITATTQVSPPSITLKWKKIPYGTPVYSIFKKTKTATAWGTAIAAISTGDTTYTDNSVVVDSAYEYMVYCTGSTLLVTPTGYIYAGIKAPAIHNRGALVLLVDSTFTDSCAAELSNVMRDINGDGWQVIRHDLSRTLKDTAIKSIIKKDYTNIPNVKSVLILGHLAVPYSGDLNPDAHPDHKGAWPADVYYGSMTGTWDDVFVNNIVSANPLNRNIPLDGKWDNDLVPSPVQLQVSRVDFNNMPAFAATEVQMMRRYLKKAHTYKMDSLNVRHRAIVRDNFGIMAPAGEAFAANGFRNFSPLVSFDSIYNLPFIATLADSSYQWAYGCGGGSYTSASGIGTTTDIASAGAVHAIFTMLFGSYFGDWNYQNNFLRAPLCADTPALTSCWAGRPNWFLHHMALGEHIGFGTRLTNNNNPAVYIPANYAAGGVHVALMGDLSLRTEYIKQPTNINATPVPLNGANITWAASPDAGVIGYYVYRTDSVWGYYQKISPMVTTLSFQDTVGTNGLKYYMVRPVKLQTTPSGSYYNLGIGITDSATVTYPLPVSIASVNEIPVDINVFPNPAQHTLGVTINTIASGTMTMYIVDISGAVLFPVTRQLSAGQNGYSLDVSALPSGIYTLCVQTGSNTVVKKWVKL
ncbi:MAG: T9SS type A sorting domain-containing protein [Taibaiella sp.]|nr:T9SS type A sorting domain-containing protein [Taibaiella sp.]